MTSLINVANIDGAFPVAGQDNNSQGFRENFTNIRTALTVAKDEISDLQSDTAKVNEANNFNGVLLENAEFNKFYGSVRNNGTTSGPTNVNLDNGPLQVFTLGGDHSLTFRNWAQSDRYHIVKLHIINQSSSSRTVTFGTEAGGIFKSVSGEFTVSGSPELVVSGNTEVVVEAWSVNQGLTVYLKKIGVFE
jgi:hypothetical protein